MSGNGMRNADRALRTRGRYGTDIVTMAQELQRLRENSFDVVAKTTSLEAVLCAPKEIAETTTLPAVLTEMRSPEVGLALPKAGAYPLTRHGHSQLAEKTGIPFRYYEAMQDAGLHGLVIQNVNAWLARQQGADRRLVRVADGRIRAVLGAQYRVLDNYDLAMLVMDRAKEHGAQVQACDLTETRMFVKLTVPEYREAILAGDDVVGGLLVSNSEVGDGAFRVEPFLFRLVCANGLIGETSLYKVHIGERLELGQVIYTDETRRAADVALWSQVRDIIDATFDQRVLRDLAAKLRGTVRTEIEDTVEVVDVTAKNLELSDGRRDSLIRYFAREGDTVYGLVNGITRLAQDFEAVEDQIRLERYAGQIVAGKVQVVA